MLKQIKFSTRIYVGIIMIVLISNVLMCAINYWQMSNGMKQLVRLYAASIPEDLFFSFNHIILSSTVLSAAISLIISILLTLVLIRKVNNKIFIMESFREGIAVPLFSVNKDKIVQFANEAICKLTGRTRDEVIGKLKGYEMLNYPSVDVCQVCKPIVEVVIPQCRAWEGEVTFKHKSGDEKKTLVTAFPVKDRKGEILEVVVMLQDITEIKHNQQIMAEQAETLKTAARTINKITELMASASDELTVHVDETVRGAELQKQRTAETASAMEQLNSTVMEVAKKASSAAESTEAARQNAQNGEKVVHESIKAIKDVQNLTNLVKGNMNQLGQKAENIGKIIKVISEIADQTNLLAINAGIEAARAGEHGRGFAVVADEVRKLAGKTMAATREIGEAIASIQGDVTKNIKDSDRASQAVEKLTELAARSGKALQEIVHIADTNADQVRVIASAAEEQSAFSEQITTAVDEINKISAKTSKGMQQAAQAIAELAEQAQKLKTLVQEMQK